MALPHTGSPNHTELLRVETELFNLYIQGRPMHPTVEKLSLHRTEEREWEAAHFHAVPHPSILQTCAVHIYSHTEGRLVPWGSGTACEPIFFETQAYTLVMEKKDPELALTFHHDNVHLREAVRPLGRMILTGMLNFQNEVGLTDLEVRGNGQTLLRLQLEIFPSKLDYKKDYQLILQDVNEQIYNLSFDFLRKTYHLTGLKESRNQSLTEFFTILQHVFDQLAQSVDRIKSAPHAKLRTDRRVVEAARVKKAGRENVAFLTKRAHLLVPDREGLLSAGGSRYNPTHVLETKRHVDYDTSENRFVRWVLLRVQQKLKELQVRLPQQGRGKDPLLAKKLSFMQGQLGRLFRHDFLHVGDMRQMSVSLVLQMAPGYREVYRCYLMLMKGLSIQSDLFHLSMKDLAQLYEYWCFLKIHHLLSRKYELVRQDILKVNRGGLFVTLDKSRQARMVYRNPRNGEVFTLYYNALPKGDSSATIGQRPDNILTLRKNDADAEYKYIFDAKYRLNPAYEGTSYQRQYQAPGPEEEDINTMHRYRDAIVYMDEGAREYERSMFGAYVLFPYQDEERFQEHRFYRSIAQINIGALPFLPNSTRLMEAFLDEIILDSPEKAYERATRPRGTKAYYANKLTGRNVVIGAFSQKEQLEAALRHKFYHTPLRNIANHGLLTQLQVVALYQSQRFFGQDGEAGIHYYGEIKAWKVVPRRDIREIPSGRGASDELYVVFEVEEWVKRRQPIVPGGHGIYRLLFTTRYMFDRAVEVAELRLDNEAELREWREKRRAGRVKVKLDREYADWAERVVAIEGE